MRRYISTVLTLTCTCTLVFGCSEPPKPQKAKNLDKIEPKDSDKEKKESNALPAIPKDWIAKVNTTEIKTSAFSAIYDLKVAKYKERGRDIPKTADRRYRKSIAERLILQEIIRQEAQAQGVALDTKALSEKMENQKKGISDWDKHLARRGESEASLREIYSRELLEQALLDKAGKLTVTDEEVDQEYEKAKPSYVKDQERVRAAHILVRVEDGKGKAHGGHAHSDKKAGTDATAKPEGKAEEPTEAQKKEWDKAALAKANEIQKLAKVKGTDFAALAKERSEGPSAAKGGDLGIFTADRMVKEFSDAAFALKPGQVSKPVRTKFGYHIIKVTGKYPPGELPKEALADQLKDRLGARKLIEGKRALKDELLAKYKVVNRIADALGVDAKPKPSTPRPKVNKPAPKVAKVEPPNPKGDEKPASHDPKAKPSDSAKPGDEKKDASAKTPPSRDKSAVDQGKKLGTGAAKTPAKAAPKEGSKPSDATGAAKKTDAGK